MTSNQTFTERILRRAEVLRITGLSKSTLYAQIARSEFARPVKIGRRAVGWRLSDIQAWLKLIAEKP